MTEKRKKFCFLIKFNTLKCCAQDTLIFLGRSLPVHSTCKIKCHVNTVLFLKLYQKVVREIENEAWVFNYSTIYIMLIYIMEVSY